MKKIASFRHVFICLLLLSLTTCLKDNSLHQEIIYVIYEIENGLDKPLQFIALKSNTAENHVQNFETTIQAKQKWIMSKEEIRPRGGGAYKQSGLDKRNYKTIILKVNGKEVLKHYNCFDDSKESKEECASKGKDYYKKTFFSNDKFIHTTKDIDRNKSESRYYYKITDKDTIEYVSGK